ncbi:MAG TPA: DNA polymerase III subunit delta [Alphaproteobacteria bacterium]|nr:MAG: DNA polymerase III subunit delta [Rhodospirillales bacterium]HOO82629.1 DNA polymerase III subunit delta [Alphaproteobacteria bacterium]
MKLAFRDIEPFVKAPNKAARVILVYGPDNGLMKERSATIGKTVVTDLNDPFNVATLSTEIFLEDPARLPDEAGAISMMGGDRLIRIEGTSDKITTLIKEYLQTPSDSALVILEAGELGPRSTLRKLCESAKNAAAVPCYVEDERDLSRLIRETLTSSQIGIDQDALTWLSANISGDRQKVRSELEKLITYKGNDNTPVTLDDVTACCGQTSAVALDDLIYATAGHNTAQALKTYRQLMEEGVSFVVILRSLQNHFLRLHLIKSLIERGDSADSAMKALSPPIFFKQQHAFKTQVNRWSKEGLSKVLQKLMDLEAQCKQTGAPVETLCAQAVLGISKSR